MLVLQKPLSENILAREHNNNNNYLINDSIVKFKDNIYSNNNDDISKTTLDSRDSMYSNATIYGQDMKNDMLIIHDNDKFGIIFKLTIIVH